MVILVAVKLTLTMSSAKSDSTVFSQKFLEALLFAFLNVSLHTLTIGSGVFNDDVQESFFNSFLGGSVLYLVLLPLFILLLALVRWLFLRRDLYTYILNTTISFQLFFILTHLILFGDFFFTAFI